jgi:hypothetical protein
MCRGRDSLRGPPRPSQSARGPSIASHNQLPNAELLRLRLEGAAERLTRAGWAAKHTRGGGESLVERASLREEGAVELVAVRPPVLAMDAESHRPLWEEHHPSRAELKNDLDPPIRGDAVFGGNRPRRAEERNPRRDS